MRHKSVTSKIMSSIRSKDTKPEKILGKTMWSNGLRYRKHGRHLPGTPDFYFTKYKIAIFCDGDFWHGNNWRLRGLSSLTEELNSYNDFWRNKIISNIKRDIKNNSLLEEKGWTVLRFWESDIKKDPFSCLQKVNSAIRSKKNLPKMNFDRNPF